MVGVRPAKPARPARQLVKSGRRDPLKLSSSPVYVCACFLFHFALMKRNPPIGVEYINEYSFNYKWTVFCGYDAFAVSLHLYRTTLQHHLQ